MHLKEVFLLNNSTAPHSPGGLFFGETMTFIPAIMKCCDPETGKLCPAFWPKSYVSPGYNPPGICLIKDNLNQVKPPRFCPMLKENKKPNRKHSRKPEGKKRDFAKGA